MSSTRYVHIRRYDFTSIRRDRKRCSVFGLSGRLCVCMSVQPLIFRPACRRLLFFCTLKSLLLLHAVFANKFNVTGWESLISQVSVARNN